MSSKQKIGNILPLKEVITICLCIGANLFITVETQDLKKLKAEHSGGSSSNEQTVLRLAFFNMTMFYLSRFGHNHWT